MCLKLGKSGSDSGAAGAGRVKPGGRHHNQDTPTSSAEAATDRREGVAGAERYQGPGQSAAGRALAASGSEQWAEAGGSRRKFWIYSHLKG